MSVASLNLPPYNNFPTITGDKILLRQILLSDIPEIVEISFYNAKPATTTEQAIEMLEKINSDYNNGHTIHWGIFDVATNKIVGTCGYYRGFEHRTGELGCILLPLFRGMGYMTEALKSAISFGVNVIKLDRIIAVTTKQNSRAVKLLERLEFKKSADLQNDEVEYVLKHLSLPGR
jgi:ribosomal-protein-alanine N-acetyltransferase